MSAQEIQIDELISKAAARNKKAFRNSMIISVIAILLGGGWLLYSFTQVRALEIKKRELQTEADSLKQQIQQENEELLRVKKELEDAKILRDNLPTNLVNQSLEANEEIQSTSPDGNKNRGEFTILYYVKNADTGKVETALRKFGFNIKITNPIRPDLPSNLIAFGEKVSIEDAKLIAYTLMRAGIEIKELCRASGSSKSLVIQVLGAESLLDDPALTVAKIRRKTMFPPCAQI